jgi:hypothetical protein
MPFTIRDVNRHKAGLTAEQKRQWIRIANSALKACLDEGRTTSACDASAIRQANGVVGNKSMKNNSLFNIYKLQANNYRIRTETLQGRKHKVIPVVMMVEGVLNGSHGPLLHLREEFGRFAESWNGIPISIQHPEEEGQPISANEPNIIESQTVGRIYNASIDSNRLCAEAWIDENNIRRISPLALAHINQQRPLEVSVGVFTDDEMTEGTWGDREYTAIARNHRPDHLALLPGGIGACSWVDGCGLGRNENKEEKDMIDIKKSMKALCREGISSILLNIKSYGDIIRTIQTKLDNMDDDLKTHYVQDVFDDFFIYKINHRNGGESTLLKRGYTVNDDESIEFTGEPETVTRQVDYVTVNEKQKKGEVRTMSKKKEKEQVIMKEKVDLLIQCENCNFEESDREELLAMSEGMLDKLFPEQKPVDNKSKKSQEDHTDAKPPQMDKEQAVQVLKDDLADTEKFIALLQPEVASGIRHAISLQAKEKESLIAHITTNKEQCLFTAEELEVKSFEELQKIASLVDKPTNYTGMGGGGRLVDNSVSEEDVLVPAGVVLN